jgi:hypothetical protein
MCNVDDCTKGFFALDVAEQKRLLIEKAQAKADSIVSPSEQQQLDAVESAGGGQ